MLLKFIALTKREREVDRERQGERRGVFNAVMEFFIKEVKQRSRGSRNGFFANT